jgi:hypothetical protein
MVALKSTPIEEYTHRIGASSSDYDLPSTQYGGMNPAISASARIILLSLITIITYKIILS